MPFARSSGPSCIVRIFDRMVCISAAVVSPVRWLVARFRLWSHGIQAHVLAVLIMNACIFVFPHPLLCRALETSIPMPDFEFGSCYIP